MKLLIRWILFVLKKMMQTQNELLKKLAAKIFFGDKMNEKTKEEDNACHASGDDTTSTSFNKEIIKEVLIQLL